MKKQLQEQAARAFEAGNGGSAAESHRGMQNRVRRGARADRDRGGLAIRKRKSLARAATRLFTPGVDPKALP